MDFEDTCSGMPGGQEEIGCFIPGFHQEVGQLKCFAVQHCNIAEFGMILYEIR